jgi:hypothetical protein
VEAVVVMESVVVDAVVVVEAVVVESVVVMGGNSGVV